MDSLYRLFWERQEVYIMGVFLPVIIGFLALFAGLIAAYVKGFRWQHLRLWHIGSAARFPGWRGLAGKRTVTDNHAPELSYGKAKSGIVHVFLLTADFDGA